MAHLDISSDMEREPVGHYLAVSSDQCIEEYFH